MDMFTDMMELFIGRILASLLMAFLFTSIVLFIIDSIKASQEKRKRKLWIKIMFIISVIIIALLIIGCVFIVFAMITYMIMG